MYRRQHNRIKSFDLNQNLDRNNIFIYNSNNNSFNKKNFYYTITNFGKDSYYNNLYNNNEKNNYPRINSNYSISTYKPDLGYNKNINDINNNSYKDFYSKSPDNNNLNSYDNKNNFFWNKSNFNKFKDFQNSDYSLNRGFSQDNIHIRNSYNYNNNKKYTITNFSSSTMAGTNGYGITKTNQDSKNR